MSVDTTTTRTDIPVGMGATAASRDASRLTTVLRSLHAARAEVRAAVTAAESIEDRDVRDQVVSILDVHAVRLGIEIGHFMEM